MPHRPTSTRAVTRPVSRPVSRAVALAATVALVACGTAGPAGAAAAEDRSADWLAAQPTDGLIHNQQYDFDDYGLTADVALALVETGGQDAVVDEIATALAGNVDAWTTFDGDVYAGSVAKAVVLAEATGGDPRDFGGVNLVKRLAARVSTDRPTVGRIQDKAADDYANVIGQALAVRGLAAAGSPKADEARDYLLLQQCERGYFRLNLPGTTKKDQSCDAGDRSGISAPDTDVTALAVLALRSLSPKPRAVRGAIADAVAWLERRQQDDGSFGGGTSTAASNSNSTGLAAWALGEAGACRPAAKAARWVRDLQVAGDTTGTPLEGENGAIAYDASKLEAAQADGITTETRDQWQRATAQAAPALGYLDVAACRG